MASGYKPFARVLKFGLLHYFRFILTAANFGQIIIYVPRISSVCHKIKNRFSKLYIL